MNRNMIEIKKAINIEGIILEKGDRLEIIGKNRKKENVDTSMIGDGQMPNMYWVTASEDYYVSESNEGAMIWASEIKKFNPKSETFGPFNTFEESLNMFQKLKRNVERPKDKGWHSIFIEDRLSGEIYEGIYEEYEIHRVESEWIERDETEYTKRAMKKAGYVFESKNRKREQEFDVQKAIKDLIEVNWSESDEEKGKAINLLKGIIYSDDAKAKKFIKDLDKLTSGMDEKDYA